MLDALHKNTGLGYPAYEIWGKFENPRQEDWICCPTCKKEVTPVIGHLRTVDGIKISVISHFRLKNPDQGGCLTGESDEHKNSKILLAHLVENKNIRLKYEGLELCVNDLNFTSAPRLAFRWEQKRENRRADVLFEFTEWHPLLGKGINFEVQKYVQTEEEKFRRENDWVKQGYSVAWVPLDHFDGYSIIENTIEVSVIWAERIFQIKHNEIAEKIQSFEATYQSKIRSLEESFTNDLQIRFQKIMVDELIDVKFNILYPPSIRLCKNCSHLEIDKRSSLKESYVCWEGVPLGVRKPPTKGILPDSTCHNWKPKKAFG